MRMYRISLILLLALPACGEPTGKPSEPVNLRLATFNVAMGLEHEGELSKALLQGGDLRLRQVAEILQRVRPDIILLNEFDYDPEIDAAGLLNTNYLGREENGQQAIHYAYSFRAPVNTGLDSGLDLDGDGRLGEPEDAFGYGVFPGQYGMLVLSRFPIQADRSRSFQNFPWSSLPGARRPRNPDGSQYYPDEVWKQLRLSSKSHWDLVIDIDGHDLHLLAYHPTPPVFDGPEDHNGARNYDDSRFWLESLQADPEGFIVDDLGRHGGLEPGARFVIAGDLNEDPRDGDAAKNAVGQLLGYPGIDSSCQPESTGAIEASAKQGGVNMKHQGDHAADTADFNDEYTGNLRLDYLLPSDGLTIRGCGVFWPAANEDTHELVDVSDHRLVWLDISL